MQPTLADVGPALERRIPGISLGGPRSAAVTSGELGLRGGREFDSIDDQTIYREHPVHQRVMTDLIAPVRADPAAVQYDAG
jgi:hypothetical protein